MRPVLTMLILVLLGGLAACAEEDHEAAFQKGKAAYETGDYAVALELWTPAAEAGHTGAQVGLGVLYDYGEGVETDKEVAENWYRRATLKKSPVAAYNLGLFLVETSIRPNPFNEGRIAEGIMYMYLARHRGSKHAQTYLDKMDELENEMPNKKLKDGWRSAYPKILDVAIEAAKEEFPDEF